MSVCRHLAVLAASGACLFGLGCGSKSSTQETSSPPVSKPETPPANPPPKMATGWKTAVTPKALSNHVKRGLAWLAQHQLPSGGWGQGDEAPGMRRSAHIKADKPNVADTSMAVMALLRSGNTPVNGEYKKQVLAGINYILSEVERNDDDSLYITKTRGTRVQAKIGTYADTFTALVVLNEAKGLMPTANANARLNKNLERIVAKIQKNQRNDGTWANRGWAPVLTQSLAAKGLNRAAQNGYKVDRKMLALVDRQARGNFNMSTGRFRASGSAGVGLYAGAANMSSMDESARRGAADAPALMYKSKNAPSKRARDTAKRQLAQIKITKQAAHSARKALVQRLQNPRYVQGFGNNGGEEFLSYMLVSESLAAKGGKDWKQWDARITQLVNKVQNTDGSWTGHHCITGRTFVTSTALLVLMADRTPVPVASELKTKAK